MSYSRPSISKFPSLLPKIQPSGDRTEEKDCSLYRSRFGALEPQQLLGSLKKLLTLLDYLLGFELEL